MSTVIKDLGAVSAYAYAVEKGYTGTEAEFAELMADYAEVGQSAEDAAESALNSKTAAQTAATTATNKASEATTAAQTATTKAGEASQSASEATTAKNDAVTAKTAAETAQGKAEDAQAAAESVAESIPSDYSQLSEDVTELNSGLSDLKEELRENVKTLSPTWTRGVYEASGYGSQTTSNWKYTNKIPKGTYKITPASGYRYEVFKYISDSQGESVQSLTTTAQVVTVDDDFIVTIAKTTTASIANMTDSEINAVLPITCEPIISKINKQITIIKNDINAIGNLSTAFDDSKFVRGNLRSGVVDTSIIYRVSSNVIFEYDFDVTIIVKNGFHFGVHTFVNELFANDSGWQTSYTIPSCTQFKLVIARTPDDRSESADIDEFVSAISFYNLLTDKFKVYPYSYSGRKISLERHTCNYDGWFSSVRPDQSMSLQGASSYENTMARTFTGGFCALYNIQNASGNVNSFASFDLACASENNHANCANFSHIFYNENDNYPLLYVTASDNNSNIPFCSVERIVESNGVYTSQQIQTITIDYTDFESLGLMEYGIYPMWLIDNNYLYAFGAKSKTYSTPHQTDIDNRIIITKFIIPSINTQNVTLTADDVLEQWDVLYESKHQLQGACIYNELIFAPMGSSNNGYIVVYDTTTRTQMAEFDFQTDGYSITQEPEDCFVYDGELRLATGNPSLYRFSF